MAKKVKPTPPREFKPGTGLHKIWNKYADEGAQAALDYGIAEGLAQSSLLTWLKSWEKREGRTANLKYTKVDKPKRVRAFTESGVEFNKPVKGIKKTGKVDSIERAQQRLRAKIEREKLKPPKVKVKKVKEDGPITMSAKYPLVTVKYIKDKSKNKVYVIKRGPEQSEVRFQHNGAERCLPNYDLTLPTEKK